MQWITESRPLTMLAKLVETDERNRPKCFLDEKQRNAFMKMYVQYCESGDLKWEDIKAVTDEHIIDLSDRTSPNSETIRSACEKLVVIKLNGGLGTRMQLTRSKTFIPVRSGSRLIDYVACDIDNVQNKNKLMIPLYFMNSFFTDKDFQKYVNYSLQKFGINQTCFQRLDAIDENFLQGNRFLESRYPPGDGEIFKLLHDNGILEDIIKKGKKWIFISNIDNIGASIDTDILCFLEEREQSGNDHMIDFLLEVTQRTPMDEQRGTVVLYKNKLKYVDHSQVPLQYRQRFIDSQEFPYINTNNIWINAHALRDLLINDAIKLDVIKETKRVSGTYVIQYEERCASAISAFKNPKIFRVQRDRFLPLTLSTDMLMLRSDLYKHTIGKIERVNAYSPLPVFQLEDRYSDLKKMEKYIPYPVRMLNLRKLTLKGPIQFGNNVTLSGDVKITATNLFIPDGAILHDFSFQSNE